MRRVLLLLIGAFCMHTSKSQNLSFSCPKDSILGCNSTCLTIKGQFPDLRSLATDYTVKEVTPISACRPYIDPGVPGSPTSLTIDDTYSAVINLPFGFPFYGTIYNSLIVSTNGYISFDVAETGNFSHYQLLNSGTGLSATSGNGYAGEDLPSSLYDAALIMGPYHDLNPAYTTSPTKRIEYNVYGTAPNRKWILSFYKVPLFNTPVCNLLIDNTHQIILHESTGVIEVFIRDKQICTSWNDGKAMVGLQDFTKTKGIMAPGRKASDPAWGAVGMNETWRFIPSQGGHLYRGVQLLDATGAVIATGDTTRINANTFETSFPNICPPSGTSLYVIKTTYQKINDPSPGATIYSLDTINIIRQAALPVTATMTPTTCGLNTGTITVTVAGGTGPYTYSLDGGSSQAGNVFSNVSAGIHTVFAQDATGCNNTVTIDVTSISSLTSTISTTATSCPGVNNGTVTVTPTAGTGPFTFTLNAGPPQATGAFTGLAAGTYTINFTDANGCTGTKTGSVGAGTAITSTSTTTAVSCPGVNNGTATVTPTSGSGPYTYTIDGGPSQSSNVFTGLASGTHSIVITDASGCTGTKSVTVGSGAGGITSTVGTTATSCPGVNNGTITITPTSGTAPYTYTLDGGPSQSSNIFTGVAAGPSHSVIITDANGCTGVRTVGVGAGVGPSGNASPTPTSCFGANDGTITVIPALAGTYSYTLNPGGIVQTSPLFTGLTANTYTVTIVSVPSGCTGTINNIVVGPGATLTGSAVPTATSCAGASDGTITATPAVPGTYNYTLNPGGIVQANNPVFTGLATGTYSVNFISPGSGCGGIINNIIVVAGAPLTGSATPTPTSCSGVNDGSITANPSLPGSYTYTLNPGAVVQVNNPLFTGLAPGTYSVSFTSASGCSGTVNAITVGAGSVLTGTAVATPTSCPTVNDGTINITPGGTGPYSFTLNPGNIVQNNSLFSNLAPGTYSITFTTASGCIGTVNVNPVVQQGPYLTSSTVRANPDCANINDGSITIVPGPEAAAPYASFTLNGPGGPRTQASPVFTNLAPGSYTYDYTDANGCTGTGMATLTTHSPITLSVAKTMPLCNGNANGIITLAAGGGLAPFEYALSPFSTYQPSGTFNNIPAGTYTFRTKDYAGCTKDTTVTLSEPTLLTASAANSALASCFGNDGTITVTGTGGTVPYQYSIDSGYYYQANNVFTAPAIGAYPNIKVKDANGCVANASTSVGLVDNMYIKAGNDTTICVGSSITFQPQTNMGTAIFNWRPLDPIITLASTISNPVIKNAVATPTDTAIYILSAQWGVCRPKEDTILVNVLHKPVAYAGEDTAVCDLTYAILRGSATNLSGTVNFVWSPAASVDDDSSAVTIARPDTTQTYILTVTDNYGCSYSVTDDIKVTVQPPVPAYAGSDTIAIKGVPHQLFGSGGADYLWTPAFPLNFSTAQNPMATLNNDQQFVLKVTDIAGCIGYDTVFIKVYDGPNYYVPNAFSPNGDGLNDIFRAIPVGITKTDWFRVFNRYGQLVFETSQWLKGWDGKYKGKPQPMGVYVWIIKGTDKNGRVVEMKGTVMLVQ